VLVTDDEDNASLNDTLIAALIGSAASFTPGLVEITDGGVVSGVGPGPGPLALGSIIYPPPRSPHPDDKRTAKIHAILSRTPGWGMLVFPARIGIASFLCFTKQPRSDG